MAGDMRRTGKPHDQRIDDQDHELTYWSEKLGISRDRLREAVAKVGSMRKAVEQQQRQPGYTEAE
jgi:flagellar biosynthesis chaperone FliJ